MTNKTIKNHTDNRVYSLRQRYLFVSAIIILLIFALAWLAQSYVTHSTLEYSSNIELRQQATHSVRVLRNEILHIEKELERYMWAPSTEHRERVHHAIDVSQHYFEQLRQHMWFTHHNLGEALGDFSLDLKSLHISLERVMDLRTETPTRRSNSNKFNRNFDHAIQDFILASNKLQQLSPQNQSQLTKARELWYQLQQQHQAHQTSSKSSQHSDALREHQRQMETLYRQLSTMLTQLTATIGNHPQAQQLLSDMQMEVELWHFYYDEQTEVHNRGTQINSRSDIQYLKHTIEPQFDHLWEYIGTLEDYIEKHSRNDGNTLTEVAGTVADFVWLLSTFGLLVISIAYLYFQRTVLQPIATVASAMKNHADGHETTALPTVHNLETRHLIEAYEEMWQQVQDRQNALEHIALHDSLTTLPNRYRLMGNLQAMCETFGQEGAIFSVMMLGLDRFKEINDTLGQRTGDDILRKFGQRLRILLRNHDNVARFASDEFAVLLHHTNCEESLYVARKIVREMEQPFDVDGINLSISCSIGIALFPDHGTDKDELTRRANIAMTTAKQHKTGINIYEERYDTSSVERISLAGMLRQAIQNNTLKLYYQAQFHSHNQQLSGLEVLCRWEDTERGPIDPEEFIPVAEQSGQVHKLTEWVVSAALEQAMLWHGRGLDFGILSINISAFDLHAPNFIPMLKTQLQRWNMPVEKLMLEITESAMMADPEHAIKTLGELNELGVKLSVDDYGTGFSSLAYVKQLPLDELKIDKSFVMDMTHNENDAVIVRSTIDLAHNLGLKVVAEGVDSQEKVELLQILECDYLQGFHLGIPVPAQQIEQVLPKRTGNPDKVSHIKDFR